MASTAAIASEYVPVRALVQRVSEASVAVDGERGVPDRPGLLVLLGVRRGDGPEQADRIARKLLALRIFEDDEGRMNRSVATPAARSSASASSRSTATRPGATGRASWTRRPPEEAEPLYEQVRAALDAAGGVFGARMAVTLVNDGPVTLLLEA